MNQRWNAIERAFASRGIAPSDVFQPPATDEEIARLEKETSLKLSNDAEAFYRVHNGQRLKTRGVLFGLELLSIDRIIENWRNWEAVADDGLNEDLADSMSSRPPDHIKLLYVNLKWLPLTYDQGGNHIGLDFDPGPKGTIGQVIAFGRDENEKKLMAANFLQFIDLYIDELNSIDWSFDAKSGWRIHDPVRDKNSLSRVAAELSHIVTANTDISSTDSFNRFRALRNCSANDDCAGVVQVNF